jgi:CBS domain-containing protein
MASLDKIPESPKQELLVVVAGPLVNVVIAILIYLVVPIQELANISLTENLETLSELTFQNFLLYLFVVNIGLVIFNIIPAFPMDGGRILRALLAMKIDRVKATQIASSIGQVFALAFLLIGLLYNPFLIFIALFIFLGAYGENQMVLHLSLLKGHTVEDAMMINITVFKPEDPIDVVVDKIIYGAENNFVVVEHSAIVGLLFHKDIIDNSNKSVLVKDVMETSFKTLDVNDDLKEVYSLIQSKRRSFFPVVENEKLVGAIDSINLNEYILLQSKLAY